MYSQIYASATCIEQKNADAISSTHSICFISKSYYTFYGKGGLEWRSAPSGLKRSWSLFQQYRGIEGKLCIVMPKAKVEIPANKMCFDC